MISFVKVIKSSSRNSLDDSNSGVKPVELTSRNEVDVDNTLLICSLRFDQVLDALGLSFEEIIGLTKLESFLA